jgi:hypothetical protein
MQTIEIPREAWAARLEEFTAAHRGWLTSVDVLDPALGAQPEIDKLPLIGVAAEQAHGGPVSIRISAGRSPVEYITHAIEAPSRIYVERREDGAELALEIESADGTKTILRFRVAALPETVDGIPRR